MSWARVEALAYRESLQVRKNERSIMKQIVIRTAVFAIIFGIYDHENLHACSPVQGYKPPTISDEVNHAPIIFVGTVSEDGGSTGRPTVIKVESVLKGEKLPNVVTVAGFGVGGDCRAVSRKGSKLIVFAQQGDPPERQLRLAGLGLWGGAKEIFTETDPQLAAVRRAIAANLK
jgi:hypothetical protein